MQMDIKIPKPLKDTTKKEFEESYTKLLDIVKSDANAKEFANEISLCSRIYAKGKEEDEVGYYTKYFVEQADVLCSKMAQRKEKIKNLEDRLRELKK